MFLSSISALSDDFSEILNSSIFPSILTLEGAELLNYSFSSELAFSSGISYRRALWHISDY